MNVRSEDPRLAEAKAYSVKDLIQRLQLPDMRQRSEEMVGPCPNCGGDDRFNVHLRSGKFLCHQCDLKGGDTIALVMECEGLRFLDALTWICGEQPADPEELERRRKRSETNQKRSDDIAAKRRESAIRAARKIWQEGLEPEGTAVRDYLALRGLSRALLPEIPTSIRFHPSLAYQEKHGEDWHTIHTGPAMLAKMVQPSGAFGGVHRTWLDLDQPGGKIRILREGTFAPANGKEELFKPKKTLGSKTGGTIRLAVPEGATTMVMGEGIETTLTALVSDVFPNAAFACAIDLGNFSGQREQVTIGNARPSTRFSEIPKLSDARAFVCPDWIDRLVFIQDGDSDPKFTRSTLIAGLQRSMVHRPGLTAQLWPTPRGMDLNDLLTQPAGNAQ